MVGGGGRLSIHENFSTRIHHNHKHQTSLMCSAGIDETKIYSDIDHAGLFANRKTIDFDRCDCLIYSKNETKKKKNTVKIVKGLMIVQQH